MRPNTRTKFFVPWVPAGLGSRAPGPIVVLRLLGLHVVSYGILRGGCFGFLGDRARWVARGRVSP